MKNFKLPFVHRDTKQYALEGVIKNPACSELEVDKWIISNFVTDRISSLIKNRPFPLDEQMLMVSAVCLVKPELIFDWGTHVGKSARIFYEATKHFNVTCTIHSIDLPDGMEHVEHPGETRGQMVLGLNSVKLHTGDGVETALKIYKKERPSNALFYIDGDHSYKSVCRELERIITNVKKPSILLHDTFNQSADSEYNTGPYRAINDVLKKHKLTPRQISTALGLPGMTLLIF